MMFLRSWRMMIAMGAFALFHLSTALAGDTNSESGSLSASAPAPPAATQPGEPAPVAKLPYGADDIVKLSRAQISDDIILNYVQNSGTAYNLSPGEVVALKNQGVSDRVIKAMLDQHKKLAEVAAQTAPAPAPQPGPQTGAPAPAPSDAPPPVATAPNAPPADAAPASSTAYVIPSPPATAPYYGYYPPDYYPYYYGYGGPVISFGFGYGGWGYGGWGRGGWGRGGWGHGGWGHGGFHHR